MFWHVSGNITSANMYSFTRVMWTCENKLYYYDQVKGLTCKLAYIWVRLKWYIKQKWQKK